MSGGRYVPAGPFAATNPPPPPRPSPRVALDRLYRDVMPGSGQPEEALGLAR